MRVTRVIYGKFFLQRHPDFMRIDFENFKIFLIITRVKILLGVEFKNFLENCKKWKNSKSVMKKILFEKQIVEKPINDC
jgi:hypothetical protein